MLDWIYRDPLRGVISLDKFPYKRRKGELQLDFVFKGCLYGASLALCMAAGLPEVLTVSGVWLLINFVRKDK